MAESFETLYRRLEPSLAMLEKRRRELRRRGVWIGGCISVAVAILLCFVLPRDPELLFVAVIVSTVFILWVSICAQVGKLTGFYKKEVIARMVRAAHPSCLYEPEKGIAESLFVESGLFSGVPDRYRTEDLIRGKVDKTDFMFAEVHAEEKHVTTNGKGQTRTYYSTLFRGFLFVADFHKDFSGRTRVCRNSLLKIDWSGERIKLENPDFEAKFDVYASDPVEARYLLSPTMMEQLLKLNDAFSDALTVGFYESKILVALPDNTDHFELSVFRTHLNRERIRREFDTVCRLIGIVDALNLNTRIWSKE